VPTVEVDVLLRMKSVPPVLVDSSFDYYCDPIVRKPPNFRFSTNEPGWHVCLANTDVKWPGKSATAQQFQMSSFVKGFWRDVSSSGRYMLWYSVALEFKIAGTRLEIDTDAGRAPARFRVNGAGRVNATAGSLKSSLEAAGFKVKSGSGLGTMSTSLVAPAWTSMKDASKKAAGGVNELLVTSPQGDTVYLYWLRREWVDATKVSKSAWFLNATVNLKQRPVGSLAGMFGVHAKSDLDVRKGSAAGGKLAVEGPWSFQRSHGGTSFSGSGDAAVTAELEFQAAGGASAGGGLAAEDIKTRLSWGKLEDLTPSQYIRQFETRDLPEPEGGGTPDFTKVDY
jgi:hypothetical protein